MNLGGGGHTKHSATLVFSLSPGTTSFAPVSLKSSPLVPSSTEGQAIPLERGLFSRGGHLILTPLAPREKMGENGITNNSDIFY